MNTVLQIIIIAFAGYIIGRISHIVGGELGNKGIHVKYSPHHWVIGLLILVVGVSFWEHMLGKILIAFGIGHIISDLSDLMHGRVFDTSHEPEIKKFWGID